MKIHIPEFKAMAKCNAHLDHPAFDIDLGDDVVMVVRCKDCKHWDAKTSVCEEFTSERLQTGGRIAFLTTPIDFCSYGERRKDATD